MKGKNKKDRVIHVNNRDVDNNNKDLIIPK